MANTSEPQATHFWIISIQMEEPRGIGRMFFQGTKTPPAGATRQDVFNLVLQEIQTDPRLSDKNFVVSAFDLQPNQL